MADYLSPVGRLVGGHPMQHNVSTDDDDKPKLDAAGNPQRQTFFYFAIPKDGTTDFKQTDFGAVMVAEAKGAFPKGEYNAHDFAWKVIDGDSAVPMKGGKPAPNTREGFPGHWVLRLTTGIPVRCHHFGKYAPHEQIQNENEIKCGDYGRVFVQIKANNSAQSPGLYLNPTLFELTRAGELIITSSGPAAADVFGGGAPTAAPAATPPPPPPVPAAATPPPPHNPLPKRYQFNGALYTLEQLKAGGWTDEQINALPTE